MKNDLLNIQQALYSSWAEFQEALLMIQQRESFFKHYVEQEHSEREFLLMLQIKLEHARDSIRDFAPNYHRDTLEGWAQASAEANHP